MMVRPGPGRFGAVVTAMVTPFDEEGRLDVDGALVLARYLADHGSDSLVIAGTTGEGPVLSDDEKVELWRALSDALTIPVIAGSGTNDTAHSVHLTRRAQDAGAAGVLVVCPYYNRPPQSGIEAHIRAVADATTLPLLIYDIPVRTGRKINRETILKLVREVPNVIGVKDAAGDVASSARLVAEAPEDFELYSGDDALTLPFLSVGGVGVISVASHWAGSAFAELCRAYFAGDVTRARDVNAALLRSYEYETGDDAPNPIPTKAMLAVLGLPGGQCRLPLGKAPSGIEARAKAVLADLETWRWSSVRA
jgi:4-hydroxy-tetrahydrodipicolinate synthase